MVRIEAMWAGDGRVRSLLRVRESSTGRRGAALVKDETTETRILDGASSDSESYPLDVPDPATEEAAEGASSEPGGMTFRTSPRIRK